MEACKQFYKTKYVRLLDLLLDLKLVREDNTYKKVTGKYDKPTVLILDEWLFLTPTEEEQRDIMELLHKPRKKFSSIFCSQYRSEGWYEQLGGDASPLADAILDRINHDTYIINIERVSILQRISLRGKYMVSLKRSASSNFAVAQSVPDRWLTPHRNGGPAAP